MKPVDFKAMHYPNSPNKYLVCPKDYSNVAPFTFSPTYPVSADQLKSITEQVLLRQPRVTLLFSSEDGQQQQYRQRSLMCRFPDFIDVRFIPIDDHQSTIAIYSRSKYGHSDFGVNKKRITFWLELIAQEIERQQL